MVKPRLKLRIIKEGFTDENLKCFDDKVSRSIQSTEDKITGVALHAPCALPVEKRCLHYEGVTVSLLLSTCVPMYVL